jgi:hypothetical protein
MTRQESNFWMCICCVHWVHLVVWISNFTSNFLNSGCCWEIRRSTGRSNKIDVVISDAAGGREVTSTAASSREELRWRMGTVDRLVPLFPFLRRGREAAIQGVYRCGRPQHPKVPNKLDMLFPNLDSWYCIPHSSSSAWSYSIKSCANRNCRYQSELRFQKQSSVSLKRKIIKKSSKRTRKRRE